MTDILHPSPPRPSSEPHAHQGQSTDTHAQPPLAFESAAAPARECLRKAFCSLASGTARIAERLSPAQIVALIAGDKERRQPARSNDSSNPPPATELAGQPEKQHPESGLLSGFIGRVLHLAALPVEVARRSIERAFELFAPTTTEIVVVRRRSPQMPEELSGSASSIKPPAARATVAPYAEREELRPPSDKKQGALAAALEQAALASREAREEKKDTEVQAEDSRRRKVSAAKDRVIAKDLQNGIRNPRAEEIAAQLEGPYAASEEMVLAQIDDLNRAEQKKAPH